MHIGYIIDDKHPLLKTILDSEIKDLSGDKPAVIIGYEKAVQLYPDLKLSSKVIDVDKRLYYAFSKTESQSKYAENLNNFLKHAFQNLVCEHKIVNVIHIEDIKFTSKKTFLYETERAITITVDKTVYYINKEIGKFFTQNKVIALDNIVSLIPKDIEIFSWTYPKYFSAYLKANLCYQTRDQIINLFGLYGDMDLFMGAVCLKWLEELKENDSFEVWHRAYVVENYLSQLKIKIDIDKLKDFTQSEENTIFESIARHVENGYVVQKYNGTDKTTGRMYPISSGFSIQTLTKNFRNIVIAEPDCVLVEFDYKYFEYDLMSQLTGLKVEGDPHTHMSNKIFGTDSKRHLAKTINYGLLYGQSIDDIIDTIYEQEDSAMILSKKEMKKQLKDAIKPIQERKVKLTEEFERNGFIINVFGRQVVPQKKYACLNNYISSTAADFVIKKISLLKDYFEKSNTLNRIILQNHDSILLNLRLEDIENTNIASDIKTLLEKQEEGLTGKVDLKYGPTWQMD